MRRTTRQQRGIVAVLVAVALVALLAIAGLALDTGHLVLNKSRLQSAVDAAALAAAKVLNEPGADHVKAELAAQQVFTANAAQLSGVLTSPAMRTPLEYSDTLPGFLPGGDRGQGRYYVRAVAENFTMWTTFSRVVGFSELAAVASAVAGPSAPLKIPGACDVLPLMVCATPGGTKDNGWGVLDPTKVMPVKVAPSDSGPPGNTGLVCLEEGNCGGNEIGDWLQGGGCISSSGLVLKTKPGTTAGPTSKGLSTRFTKSGLPDYPPDQVTAQVAPQPLTLQGTSVFFCADGTPDKCKTIGAAVTSIVQVHLNYADYKQRASGGPLDEPKLGRPDRRVVALPVVKPEGCVSGGREAVEVVDLACFYLLQDVIRVSGNPAYVLGQYTGEPCAATGTPGDTPGPGTGTGVFKIVLHNDPLSDDS